MAFEVADRDPTPALSGADQGGEHELHRRLLVQQSRDDFRSASFLNKGPFHQVGGPHVDTMPHRYPMHRQQRIEIILEASDCGGELSAMLVDNPIRLCPRRIQRGGVPNRTDLGDNLRGRVVGELGPNVCEAMEPATDPDRLREHRFDGPDQGLLNTLCEVSERRCWTGSVSAEEGTLMMTTNDDKTMGELMRPVIDDELVDRLMGQVDVEGLELLGPDGILTELTSRILSRGLGVEMADHLGYERGDLAGWGSGNNRNGSYDKTVRTDAGTVAVEMPRDRNATFEPQLIPKHQRRLSGFNDLVISLVGRGMTVRDTQALSLIHISEPTRPY